LITAAVGCILHMFLITLAVGYILHII
jgi:hypothetical protein